MVTRPHETVDEWALNEARRIVTRLIGDRDIKVYLHGSRAKGNHRQFSDIDIALEGGAGPLDPALLAEIREALAESHIPYTADVVDLATTDQRFRDRVRREGILWKG